MKKLWLSSGVLLLAGIVALASGVVTSPQGRMLSDAEMTLTTGGGVCSTWNLYCPNYVPCSNYGANPQLCHYVWSLQKEPNPGNWSCSVGPCSWSDPIMYNACDYYTCIWTIYDTCVKGAWKHTDWKHICTDP